LRVAAVAPTSTAIAHLGTPRARVCVDCVLAKRKCDGIRSGDGFFLFCSLIGFLGVGVTRGRVCEGRRHAQVSVTMSALNERTPAAVTAHVFMSVAYLLSGN
jgi:hypothetical protein